MAFSRLKQYGVKETDEKFDKLQYENIPTSDRQGMESDLTRRNIRFIPNWYLVLLALLLSLDQ